MGYSQVGFHCSSIGILLKWPTSQIMESYTDWSSTQNSTCKQSARYKPISCCTMFYKVISKLLASRLADVTGQLLHATQTAFVKGRIITDNIQLAQELLRNYTRMRISPRCILKVDLQKAFNSIHWVSFRTSSQHCSSQPSSSHGSENVLPPQPSL